MLDPIEFGNAMAAIVNDAVAPLKKRIEELEAREPQKGDPGESLTVEDVAPIIEAQVKEAVEAIPPPKDGNDADPVVIADVVRELLAANEIKTLVNMEVADYLQKNPPAKGDPGKSLCIEDVSLFLDAAIAKWALEFERRATDTLARAIDKIPEPKNGRDGVAMPTLEWDGERTATIKAANGDVLQVCKLALPLDRGYYRDGMKAEKGDILTHNGDAWIALKDTGAKPCRENAEDWRLFARKGRDGRDYRDAPQPKPVSLARD